VSPAAGKAAFFMSRRLSDGAKAYGSRWARLAKDFLKQHPLCRMCGDPAQVVDHTEKHDYDAVTFWDRSNWQSLCKACHDGPKQRMEKARPMAGVDGLPLDPDHPWSRSMH
jgi:5-methylcytosine-specific restriction endonuclease McrA